MAELLIKRDTRISFISGAALRLQRENAGLSQSQLVELIAAATGCYYLILNGQLVALNKMTVCRMEHAHEFSLEYYVARIIQKILSK